ncbi:MAG: glycosyltransferase family 4 protein [Clostridia bacterium]|nr:glycosyltransferase family 4 protein [Clostridia bacterium]
MKILITTDLFTTATNGVVTSIKNLREALQARGHEIRILTVSDNKESRKEDGVYYIKSMSVEFIYPEARVPLSYKNAYIDELIDWNPDVIHSQCELCSYQFALTIAEATGAPIVHTYHTMYEDYIGYVLPGKRFGKWLVKKLVKSRLKSADAIVVPTQKVENSLLDYGVDKKLFIVPSGISLDQHRGRVSEDEKRELRAKWGVAEKDLLLLYLGRMGTEKNIAELVRFFAKGLEKNPNMTFMIVGGGPERENLEKLTAELGVENKVVFTGMVPPTETHRYYQLGDVFVSASTSETQGLTYVEAMANGLPLLCRNDECLNDLIINGINGYTYVTEEEFLDALDSIAHNKEWRVQAGNRSADMANVYDKSEFALKLEKIYEEVCNSAFENKTEE